MQNSRPPVQPSEHDRQARLLALVDAFAQRRVAVVGDIVADEFLTGQISRVSREAPVLILRYDAHAHRAGWRRATRRTTSRRWAVASISSASSAHDEQGRALAKSFPAAVRQTGVMRPAGFRTPTKTRVLAGGIHSAKQQIVRIDREPNDPLAGAGAAGVRREGPRDDRRATPCCSSDYGYGVVTPLLADGDRRTG